MVKVSWQGYRARRLNPGVMVTNLWREGPLDVCRMDLVVGIRRAAAVVKAIGWSW